MKDWRHGAMCRILRRRKCSRPSGLYPPAGGPAVSVPGGCRSFLFFAIYAPGGYLEKRLFYRW